MPIFGHSKFLPDFLCQKGFNKFGMHIFCILNLYHSFWEKLLEKIQNGRFWPFPIYTSLFGKNCWKKFGTAIFGHSQFIPVFLGKIVRKNSEWPFLAIPSLFGKNFKKKFGMAIFCHSKFIPVFLGKIVRKNSEFIPVFWEKIVRKNSEHPFLAILNFF